MTNIGQRREHGVESNGSEPHEVGKKQDEFASFQTGQIIRAQTGDDMTAQTAPVRSQHDRSGTGTIDPLLAALLLMTTAHQGSLASHESLGAKTNSRQVGDTDATSEDA